MFRERLAQVMQAQREARGDDPKDGATHETILGIFQALYQGDITAGRAIYLLNYQAMHWADEPAQGALYRQAAAAIRRLPREER